MTPRQELILNASQQLIRWRNSNEMKTDTFGGREPFSTEDAIIAVLDGHFNPGSMGEQMRTYYAGTSKRAHRRLLNEIAERAHPLRTISISEAITREGISKHKTFVIVPTDAAYEYWAKHLCAYTVEYALEHEEELYPCFDRWIVWLCGPLLDGTDIQYMFTHDDPGARAWTALVRCGLPWRIIDEYGTELGASRA